MIKKLCLFILLIIFSNSVFAEYYLVYTPPQCVDCVEASPPPVDYKTYKHKYKSHKKAPCKVARHHKAKYKPKAVKVYKQRNSCGEYENCIVGDGYAISTSQPRYYGEHCTTYEDQLVGRQEYAGY